MLLPLYEPHITTYHYHADMLSVIPENDKKHTWLMNNYIQLETQNTMGDFSRLDFSFPYSIWKSCPLIYYQRLNRNLFEKNGNVVDFMIDSINLGFYIYINIDKYYVADNFAYKKFHFTHDAFVYGYDLDEKVFYVKEYEGLYKLVKIDFNDMRAGYRGILESDMDWGARNSIELISYSRENDCLLNIPYIKESLQDYLSSQGSHKMYVPKVGWRIKDEFVFGMDIYRCIRYFLTEYLPGHPKTNEKRLFHALYIHKKLMATRIEYLGEEGYLNNAGYLLENYNMIASYAHICLNLYLKYEITGNMRLMENVLNYIDIIEKRERSILSFLVESLSDVSIYANNTRPKTIFFYHKEGQPLSISKNVPLLESASALRWSGASPVTEKDNQFIVNEMNDNELTITGVNNAGEVEINYTVQKHIGFKTNLTGWKASKGLVYGEGVNGLSVNSATGSFYVSDLWAGDGTIESDLCIEKARGISIIFRADQYLRQLYNVFLDSSKNCIQLIKHTEGFVTAVMAESPENIENNRRYHLKVEVKDNIIKVYFDNNLKFEVADGELPEGFIGLNICDGSGYFQNFYAERG